ncbi:hypothetical protein NEOLEDRAFT_1150052 [Neolentinus lepideus HHB14362 ss-1]|uniref:ABM domain-containing protein n=1 Tax=Neolentinus lepideus HHB14362 ss-1 TaxID=1314782 RepID=A0A165QFD9_9AGAM|nr:hypothetical protein NEOLEDRAFT_1150052 [Neolentinus lepideus HHB14362 ss-1]
MFAACMHCYPEYPPLRYVNVSTHITEILRATVNDRFTSEPSLHAELRAGANQGGLPQQAWGLNVNKPNELFWLLFFPEGLDPKDFQLPAEYGDFPERLAAIGTSEPASHFLPFELPERAIKAPVTELAQAFITIKPSVKHEDVRSHIEGIVDIASAAPGCFGGRWAFSNDDNRLACCILGWESSEAHAKATEIEAYKRESQLPHQFMERGEAIYVEFATQNI